ncbi:MAG: response regulator transcription factor [Anaerolineae bacterium]|nr:response regulator transcription factor [Anaerolineae bacterium]
MDHGQGPPIPGARVLIVDDEETTRRAITRALELTGYEAEGVASGEHALARLASSSYDLMLLDLRMPGMDGVDVMHRVAARYPDLLVIVFTAHATVDSAIEAVRAGAVDYLLKPTSVREVHAAVSRALEQRREKLRRRHLIRVMAEALAALQAEEAHDHRQAGTRGERFLHAGPVALDMEKRLVVVSRPDVRDSLDAELTENEAALLGCLMENPGAPLSCRVLAATALGYDVIEAVARGIVRPHISRLRKKIEFDPTHPTLVRTIRGQGYLFTPEG